MKRLYDAHNHLQMTGIKSIIKVKGIVCSTFLGDFDKVAEICTNQANLIPAFGIHPW